MEMDVSFIFFSVGIFYIVYCMYYFILISDQDGFKWLLRKLRPRLLQAISNGEIPLGPIQPRSIYNYNNY